MEDDVGVTVEDLWIKECSVEYGRLLNISISQFCPACQNAKNMAEKSNHLCLGLEFGDRTSHLFACFKFFSFEN